MTNDAAEFLHKKLHADKHTEDEVKTVIETFPSALSHMDNGGRLPIQSAVCFTRSLPFVPLLAKEGATLKVGGEGKRGGLLVEDPAHPASPNVVLLQILAGSTANNSENLDVI